MTKRIIVLFSIMGALAVAAYIVWQANIAVAQPAPGDRERPAFKEREGDAAPRRQFRRPEGRRGPGGMFALRGMMGGVAICANESYVYVVKGNTLYQFEADGLKLVERVALEENPPPPRGPGQRRGGRRGPPQDQKDNE